MKFNKPDKVVYKSRFVAEARKEQPLSHLLEDEKTKLMQKGKCFICRQLGHRWYHCPNKKRKEMAATEGEAKGDARDDPKGKKPKPSVGLVPDVIGDTKEEKRTALCRT